MAICVRAGVVGVGGVSRAVSPGTREQSPRSRRSHVTRRAEPTDPRSHEPAAPARSTRKQSRRLFGASAVLLATSWEWSTNPACAFERPPPGYKPFNDTIDGYKLLRPDDWIEVKGSGNDVFFRNPASAEENMFVSISSPSSTKFDSPRDLGPPRVAAQKVLDQTLAEFMSTRIGVRREARVVAAAERVGADARGDPVVCYDFAFRLKSFATKNQYGLTEADRPQALEWDRVLSSTLVVANKRLYELRTQCAAEDYEKTR